MAKVKKSYNASDSVSVMDAAQRDENERDQQLADIKSIISRPDGMRFFRRLMGAGRVFQTTFTGNSQTYFLEGHRNLVLQFFNDIVEAAPGKIAELMVREKEIIVEEEEE